MAGRIQEPLLPGAEAIRLTRSRALAAAGVAGILCTGLPASGLADAVPEGARALAVLAGVLLVPALAFLPLARRAVRGAGTPTTVTLALFLWLSALASWTWAFARTGAPFHVYAAATTWAVIAACAGVALRGLSRRIRPAPGRGTGLARTAAWIPVLVIVAALAPPTLTANEDGPDHVGYVRRIAALDSMRPAGILAWPVDAAVAVAPDPRKGAFHPVVALAADLSGADPVTVWRWLPLFLFPAGVLAYLSFQSVFVRGGPAVFAAALFFLSYGGSAWQFAPASAYGQNLAASWGWAMVPLCFAIAREGWSAARALSLAGLVVGGAFVHLGVVLHAAVFAAGFALFGGWAGIAPRARWGTGGAVALLAAGALLARGDGAGGGMNTLHGHVQGVMYWGGRWFAASPMEILRQHGMLFLGGLSLLPVTALAARARADARAILCVSVVPLLVACSPLAVPLYERGSYMVFRALLGVPAFAVAAMSIAWVVAAARRRGFAARVAGAVALTAWALVFVRPSTGAFVADTAAVVRGERSAESVSAALVEAVAALPAGSTILADPATAYLLSARTTHRFVALHQQHAHPRDPYDLDRLQAVRDVLSPYAVPDVALAACRRYRVDYVVLSDGFAPSVPEFLGFRNARTFAVARARLASMPASFVPVDSVAGGSVYRFEPGGVVRHAWGGVAAPVVVESPVLLPCDVEAPDGVFRITGIAVHPATVLPGDTVTLTLGYARENAGPFGLPVLIHVRFDHETVSSRRGPPFEKQARRAAERWTNSHARFRADVRPGGGVFEPDLWPIGAPLCERVRVAVPRNARLGEYRVEVAVVRDSLLPNFHAADLFFDRDHYSGLACARLRVSDRVTGDEP